MLKVDVKKEKIILNHKCSEVFVQNRMLEQLGPLLTYDLWVGFMSECFHVDHVNTLLHLHPVYRLMCSHFNAPVNVV